MDQGFGKYFKKHIMIILGAICWGIWKERNNRTFEYKFLWGLGVFDRVLIVNECMKDRKISSKNGLTCKFDLKKTYDYVKYNFLDYILDRMGFRA